MKITLDDVCESFDAKVDDFSNDFLSFFISKNWEYEMPSDLLRDKIIIDNFSFMETDKQKVGSEERKVIWENGWKEQTDRYLSSKSRDDLIPLFLKRGQPLRFDGEFIIPKNPNFEIDYVTLFHKWFFPYYMGKYKSIYEFGCGSGFNLVSISDIMKDKILYGCDFSHSSIELINHISKELNININGIIFDMTNPDYNLQIDRNSCIFTFGAIEQLAGNFVPFINYIIEKRPELCIHVEPIIELYDKNSLVDYTAICFHKQRGYTQGFLPYLQTNVEKRIDLIKYHRLRFGNLRMEGYNYVVWRPI